VTRLLPRQSRGGTDHVICLDATQCRIISPGGGFLTVGDRHCRRAARTVQCYARRSGKPAEVHHGAETSARVLQIMAYYPMCYGYR